MRRFTLPLIVLTSLFLAACSAHKIDVQQGNVITQEMLETLTPGMDKQKVKQLLGTPVIRDPFHADRWDYVYSFKSGDSGKHQAAQVVLFFDGDSLATIDVRKPPPPEAEVMKPSLRGEGVK